MDNRTQLMELIQTAAPSQIFESPLVADRFKDLYKVIHGVKDARVAEAFYTAEKFHFLKLINDSTTLKQCTKLSLYGIFMDVAVSGLSFDPSMKHLYIVPYNVNVGTQQDKRWEKRAALQISGTGELLLRTIQGQVKYADQPVVVYEGDEFRYGTRNGETVLDHIASIPRKSENIIAAYVAITRHDGTKDFKVMAMEDIRNLQKFSKDPNSLAWTAGLKGMVEAKVIKHAFKNYPKVRMGEFSKLQSEVIDEVAEVMTDAPTVDYGFGTTADQHQTNQQHSLPAADENLQFNPQFNPAAQADKQQTSTGITHDDENF